MSRRASGGRLRRIAAGLAGLALLTSGVMAAGAPARTPAAGAPARVPAAARGPFAVGEIVVTYIDPSRMVRFPGRPPEPRQLVTVIRYPAVGPASRVDRLSAAPATAAGPFPLVVFAHGFDVTAGTYSNLLEAWARAGYVVAAPIFPRTNVSAPGGPDEADIVNQPADISYVITCLLAASAADHGILAKLIDPHEIAVAGHSDGAETALATAYDPSYHDPRVDAAVILSGAEMTNPPFTFVRPSPPLLATQGTADTINLPQNTYQFFDVAPPPKYLLELTGARHLPPYTREQPQLAVVERVTTAFLDLYLKHLPQAGPELAQLGNVSGVASLFSDP